MSMCSCAGCGDIYDTDFQMEVDAEGNCICDRCREEIILSNSKPGNSMLAGD